MSWCPNSAHFINMSSKFTKHHQATSDPQESSRPRHLVGYVDPTELKHYVTPEKREHHAEILANRVKKQYRHLVRRMRRNKIDCFRLYDWDIPEVRAVVDWYAGHVVIAEYERLQTGPDWLPRMAEAVGEALDVPKEKVFMKRRRTNSSMGARYKTNKVRSEKFVVQEHELKFWVNLSDNLDTGLFSDHRETRLMVQDMASGKDVLNLFAYTGAFTCAAALGGAKSTLTIDRSSMYLDWAKENLELNELGGKEHRFVRSDTETYLDKLARTDQKFTLAIVDPPSFSQRKGKDARFDINRHHPELLEKVAAVMAPKAIVLFSTNHQRFEPSFDGLPFSSIEELTPKTIPEDYRNREIHRCWQMKVK